MRNQTITITINGMPNDLIQDMVSRAKQSLNLDVPEDMNLVIEFPDPASAKNVIEAERNLKVAESVGDVISNAIAVWSFIEMEKRGDSYGEMLSTAVAMAAKNNR